jgi:hypothetical protein
VLRIDGPIAPPEVFESQPQPLESARPSNRLGMSPPRRGGHVIAACRRPGVRRDSARAAGDLAGQPLGLIPIVGASCV